MSRASGLIAKANKVLAANNAFDRTVYIRTTVLSGGDSLLGRYGTVTNTDILMTPQPFVQRLGRNRIPGGHATAETYNVGSNVKIADDYIMLVTSTMMSIDELQSPLVQLIFKDSLGSVETLVIHDFETASLDDTDVVYTLYVRSSQNNSTAYAPIVAGQGVTVTEENSQEVFTVDGTVV